MSAGSPGIRVVVVLLSFLLVGAAHADLPSTGNAALDQALREHAAGNTSDAIVTYQSVVERGAEPVHAVRALLGIGGCYFQQKDYDEAVAAFLQLADRYPTDAHAPLALTYAGNARMDQKLFEEAKGFYTRALAASTEHPENARVWVGWANLGMGRYLTDTKQFEQALPYLDKAIAHAQEPKVIVEANIFRSRCLSSLGRGTEALAALDTVLATDRSGPYPAGEIVACQTIALKMKAPILEEQGRRPEAQLILKAAAAMQQVKEGKAEAAKDTWRDAAGQAPATALGEWAVGNLARLYEGERAYREGIEKMRGIATEHRHTTAAAAANLAVGRFLCGLDDIDGALAAYQNVLKHDSNSDSGAEAVRACKQIWCESRGGRGIAIDKLQRIATAYPGTEAAARAQYCIGEVHRSSGEDDLTDQVFVALLEEYPSSKSAGEIRPVLLDRYRRKARRCEGSNDLAGTISALQVMYKIDDDQLTRTDTLLRLGQTSAFMERYDDAHSYLQQVISDPSPALSKLRENAKFLDAVIYNLSGDRPRALAALKEFVKTSKEEKLLEAAKEQIRLWERFKHPD